MYLIRQIITQGQKIRLYKNNYIYLELNSYTRTPDPGAINFTIL